MWNQNGWSRPTGVDVIKFLMMIRPKIVLLFQHFRALYHYQKFYDEIVVGIGHPIWFHTFSNMVSSSWSYLFTPLENTHKLCLESSIMLLCCDKNLLWFLLCCLDAPQIINRNSIEFYDFWWIVKYTHFSILCILLLLLLQACRLHNQVVT